MPLQKARDTNQPVNTNTSASRPLMPSLASNRNVKSPITPRLATQHVGATTPLAKPARVAAPATLKSPGTREELSTPAKAFINNNVTPRSGSRKSRVDSNHTTPSGTPNGSRPSSHVDTLGGGGKQQTPFAGFGLGIAGSGKRSRPNSMVGGAHGATSPSITSQPKFSRLDGQTENPMFFHASDVQPQRSPELRPVARKSPVFLYANGQQDESITRPTSQPSPPLSSVSTKSKKSQFFRAGGRSDDDIPPVPSLPSPSMPGAPPQFFQASPALRPPSPGKDANFHLSYRKGASQIIRPGERPKTISILPPNGVDARKHTIGGVSAQGAPHKRTSSLSSIESGISARGTSVRRTSNAGIKETGLSPLQTILRAQSPISTEPPNLPVLTSSPSLVSEKDPLGESTASLPRTERQASPSSPALSMPQSPTKGPGQWQSQLNETIMNARVERKIQDLEISNSSLMAINKSLEKEVRRQNKELRRFRRLSRAGRLSTLSGMESMGTVDDGDDDLGTHTGTLSALDEISEDDEDEDEDEEAEESSDESSSSDGASLSPEAIAEREERKLAKDSKRLQLDLARHRDILVDSQKLNQSLKRCMACTELMIKDGRKALDYKAETELGGRILDHEDEEREDDEDDGEPRHTLLGSWSPGPMPHLEALDGLLGLDTSAITKDFEKDPRERYDTADEPASPSSKTVPEALAEGGFWSVAAALP